MRSSGCAQGTKHTTDTTFIPSSSHSHQILLYSQLTFSFAALTITQDIVFIVMFLKMLFYFCFKQFWTFQLLGLFVCLPDVSETIHSTSSVIKEFTTLLSLPFMINTENGSLFLATGSKIKKVIATFYRTIRIFFFFQLWVYHNLDFFHNCKI